MFDEQYELLLNAVSDAVSEDVYDLPEEDRVSLDELDKYELSRRRKAFLYE
mgnify:CR=1 FL=1